MKEKFLTIVIPTYNRKEKLIRQLQSIEKIGRLDWYHLVILDNHSNYDITDALRSKLSNTFFQNIEIVKRKFNTGIGFNIASTFTYSKTKWLWIISDDDVTPPDALDIIYDYSEKYPDAAIIEFSIGLDIIFKDQIINSLGDLQRSYDKKLFISGDLMYIGNNLYNCHVQQEYFGENCAFCYTLVPQIISTFRILEEQKSAMILSSRHVQTFIGDTSGDSWHTLRNVLAICSIYDIKWHNYSDNRAFSDMLTGHLSINNLLFFYLSNENDLQYRKYAYYRLKNTMFKRPMSLTDKIKIKLYGIQMNTGLPVLSIAGRLSALWKKIYMPILFFSQSNFYLIKRIMHKIKESKNVLFG